ncbi:MAG TPA: hypothetical protein VNX88_19640 [Terriglobales bacterium]|jgi:hypothetical protein|nr:hypothetical protein [Terriglobales bacterium]
MKRFENRYPTPESDPLIVRFPGEEPEEPKSSKAPVFHTWASAIVAAVLSALLAWGIGNIAQLKQHPIVARLLFAGVLAAGLASIAPFAWRRFRNWRRTRAAERADAEFVAAKEQELRELLSTFRVFVANHDIRSLRNILRSALAEDIATLAPILGNEYAENWAHFLDLELKTPSTSEQIFSNRAAEFTSLVNNFSRTEIQPAQKIINASKQQYSDSFLDALEQFREGFNAFTRDLQKWAASVNEHLIPKLGYHTPNQNFEYINPFHRAKAAVVGITVNGV